MKLRVVRVTAERPALFGDPSVERFVNAIVAWTRFALDQKQIVVQDGEFSSKLDAVLALQLTTGDVLLNLDTCEGHIVLHDDSRIGYIDVRHTPESAN